MSVKIFPKTKLGEWSIGLICAFFIIMWGFFKINEHYEVKGNKFLDNLALAVPLILALLSALTALIFGLLSIFKHKDRAIAVFISSLLGLLIILYALGEIFLDHT